ncbi:MAG TPA: winged helix-turn-helix domain-containing protein [Verrucomicrobiae bacterium]|nr:winged helix-turn-helix domain-containing protein [Verrucomicrobiae bacterium]
METVPRTTGRIAFDQFEVDLRSGELRKRGHKIRLQPQPFQLLALLLEHSGEVVTREEVRAKLWPDDVHIDFDHGLGTALNKIREALNDSAEHPRFIETLPRRGYRFIGAIRGPITKIAETAPATETPSAVAETTRGSLWKAALWLLALGGTVFAVAHVWLNQRSHAAGLVLKAVPFTAYTGLEVAPAFSPDGSQIAFSWTEDKRLPSDGYDLYVKAIGDENPVRVTTHPSRWISSAWSTDGRSIAIHRVTNAGSGIYLVPARGGPEQKLRATYAANSVDAAISWSPDGQSIAFSDAASSEGKRRIQLLSIPTLESTQIPHDETCKDEQMPAFSHDGTKLAYVCALGWEEYGIAVQDLQRQKPRILQTFRGWVRGLVWTVGDRSLILSQSQVGNENNGFRELALADGSIRLLPYGRDGSWPAISANGQRFAYDTYSDGHNNIWRLDLANLHQPPVELISSTRDQNFAQYSPDGSRIAFVSTRSGNGEIWMSDAQGKGLLQLTDMGQPSGTPRWSPDGKQIAFDSRVNGHAAIYVLDLHRRQPRKLTINVDEPSVPSWSRDGKWIYFIGGAGPNGARIYRVPAEGGEATPLSMMSGYGPVESFDEQRVFFAVHNGKHARLESASLKPTGTENLVQGMPALSFAANWAIVQDGAYFYPADSPETLTYFNFATETVRPVFEVGRGSYYGLSISPDGRYALYSQLEGITSDIMLINNFY